MLETSATTRFRRERSSKNRKGKEAVAYVVVGLIRFGLALVVGVQLLKGSVLYQLTNGKLEDADYWSEKPAEARSVRLVMKMNAEGSAR